MILTEISRPALPAFPIEGGCHCGAVRYRVTARPKCVNACHCKDCQRLTGASHGLFLHLMASDLERLSGTFDVFRRRGGSGNMIPIERCTECGTRMWHLPEAAPDLVILCAGTLDDSSWAVATSHIFVGEAIAGSTAASDALVIEEFRSTRPALWGRFEEIYGPPQ
ncbi:MAG: GFA family protein [Hyphomonas sp.]|uniref:GFA family protein n=1 Tax=Hyphomonas sp. TaxID=87 RepID=UPI0035280631